MGYEPPGLLLSMTKTGLAPTVLAELAERTIAPLAVGSGGVIVRLEGAEAGFVLGD